MQTHVVPMTHEGEVTIPAEVRRYLGASARDAIEFVIRDDGLVELRRPSLSLDDVFGILPPLNNASLDFDEEIEQAIEEHVTRKWGRQSQ